MFNLSYQRYLNSFIKFDRIIWDDFSARCKKNGNLIISKADGLASEYSKLEWDTKILNVASSRIDNIFFSKLKNKIKLPLFVKGIEKSLKSDSVRFVSFRFDINHFDLWQSLEDSGWKTVDIMNVYSSKLPLGPGKVNLSRKLGLGFLDFSLSAALELFKRSKDLFIHSRIYNDDKISRNKASLFYRRLFEALYKQPDIVRVGLFKGKRLIGFALGNRDGFLLKSAKFKLGYLGEIVIDPSFRGRGYSKLLLRRFSEIISRKVDYLEIGTQINNGPANRLYTAEGFNLVANAVTMHKWLK